MGPRARGHEVRRLRAWRRSPEGAARDPSLPFRSQDGESAVRLCGRGRRQQPVDARAGAEGAARARTRSARRDGAAGAARYRPGAVPAGDRHARRARALPHQRAVAVGAHGGAARAVQRGGHGGARRRAVPARRHGRELSDRGERQTAQDVRAAGRGAEHRRARPLCRQRARSGAAGRLQPRERLRRRVASRRRLARRGVRGRAGGSGRVRITGDRGEIGRPRGSGPRRRDRPRRESRRPGSGGHRAQTPARRSTAGAPAGASGPQSDRDLLQLGPCDPRPAGHRITSLLLAFNFPPHGGGIARMMGELALRYPHHSLVISTGSYEGGATSDARFPQIIDRSGIRATRLRTVQGLALWTWRAGALAKQWRPGFTWCAELKPAGYPARWLAARHGVPYGVIVHGTELLLIEEKMRRSRFKRGTAGSIIGKAAVIVANSRWTADLARNVLSRLDVEVPVETVPLGTTPSHFRPGVDPSAVRRKFALNGGPWLLTVARLEWHKGVDTMMKALPAVR